MLLSWTQTVCYLVDARERAKGLGHRIEPIPQGSHASSWRGATMYQDLSIACWGAQSRAMQTLFGCDHIPPGGAMEAPKDPDTRPGPPPSANVPLGMGMYRASAFQHHYDCAEGRRLLSGGLLQAAIAAAHVNRWLSSQTGTWLGGHS